MAIVERKPNGIHNYGWNCYINSVLQSLASSNFITNYLKSHLEEDQSIINTILKFDLKFCTDLDILKDKCDRYILKYNDCNNDIDMNEEECNNIKYIRKHYAYFYGYICFRNIINDINTGDDKIIDPNEFIEVSKLSSKQVSKASINQMFVHLFIGEQNDPSELLAYIFEIIHYCKSKKMKFNFTELEENCNENKIINRYRADYKKRYEKEYSLYVRNFIFYTMKTIRCDKCDYVNFNLMPVHILLLPIPSQNSISVFDCLHEYTKKESLDSDYKCDKCKGTDNSTIENSILSDNNTVILQFSRFELNKTCTDYNKNCSQIDFPLNLNLTDYVLAKGNHCYELYAVILHFGSMDGGHYISCVKKNINGQDKWFLCDDGNIKEISEADLLNHKNAYVLFYQTNKNK